MSVKTMQVFECDYVETVTKKVKFQNADGSVTEKSVDESVPCGKLAAYGRLPDDWVWYLDKREVASIGTDGVPTGKKVQLSNEHEFCSEKHRDEWIKANK